MSYIQICQERPLRSQRSQVLGNSTSEGPKIDHDHQSCVALAEDSTSSRVYGGKLATPHIKGTKPIVLCRDLNIEGTGDFLLEELWNASRAWHIATSRVSKKDIEVLG